MCDQFTKWFRRLNGAVKFALAMMVLSGAANLLEPGQLPAYTPAGWAAFALLAGLGADRRV